MSNLLTAEWPGTEWGPTGNDQTGIRRVTITNADGAEVNEEGLLLVTFSAGQNVSLWVAGTSGTFSGDIPNNLAGLYDTRLAFMPDVELATAELQTYIADRDGMGQSVSLIGGNVELEAVPPDEITDVRTESTFEAVARDFRAGKIQFLFQAAGDGTILIAPPFYGLSADVPESIAWPGEDDDEGGEVEPVDPDELAAELAPRVAGYIGKAGNQQAIEMIAGQLPVIVEFVRGYTRGRGFDEEGNPNAALRACIVSAASRVASNPKQLRQYSVGDYSATPALLMGFTLTEQATLNNYRKRWA